MGFGGSEWYPADVDAVVAMFCDHEAITERFTAAGDRDVEIVRCTEEGDELVIETRRQVSVDIPGFARKFLRPTNTMNQTDRWGPPDSSGARRGTFGIEVAGAPVGTSGTHELVPDGDGTRHSVEADIEVSIPLVGRRVAGWAEGAAQERLRADFAFNRQRFG